VLQDQLVKRLRLYDGGTERVGYELVKLGVLSGQGHPSMRDDVPETGTLRGINREHALD